MWRGKQVQVQQKVTVTAGEQRTATVNQQKVTGPAGEQRAATLKSSGVKPSIIKPNVETLDTSGGDYRRISIDISNRILMHIRDSSGWKEIKRGNNVIVFMKPSCDYSGHMYRVEAVIEAPPEKLFQFVYLPEYRGKWDKALQQYKIVDIIDQDTFIVHSITHSYGLGLVSPRDFVFIMHIKNYDGKLMTTNSVSVDHPKVPPTSQYVRGTSFPCGYAVYPLPDNPSHSKFLAICQVDLGGMLRPSVIDSAMPSTLLNLITDCRAGLKSLK